MDVLERVLKRIDEEVWPRLDLDKFQQDDSGRQGYDCCGCATYRMIVEDIETIIREERAQT